MSRPAATSSASETLPASQMNAQDSFIDLLIETLQTVDKPVRAQFLQRFFKAMAQVDLPESLSLDYWEQILARRQELSQSLGKPVSLKTAMVDVLASTSFLRLPVLMEYEDLKKLQVNAATDALTGLYNRRLFDEYFAKELNRARRYGHHFALVMMDLHRFKEVNDRYGHMHGDQALQIAASTLRRTLRTSDYAFRIGGDEFALLLQQADPEQAETLCKRLRTGYEAGIAPLHLEVPLGIDYGVATFPEDGDSKEKLVHAADERLYRFKNANRAAVVPPRVIPMEVPTPREVAAFSAPVPAKVAAEVAHRAATERRKWERVSMVGTRAYAVLGEESERTARVLDLSYGGVALQIDPREWSLSTFNAVLHVPILPPVRVSLRQTYAQVISEIEHRIGCAFVS